MSGSLEKESLPESLEERGGEGANGVISTDIIEKGELGDKEDTQSA